MPLPRQLPDNFNAKATNKSKIVIDRYTIVKKIGSGNFGTAFLILDNQARNNNEKQKVLKQICVGPLDPGETVDAMHEANLLSKMKHKNIVQFHDSFLDGQFFCIVLEYCEGGDLECKIKDVKKKNETISEDQVIKWLKQLLKAISYMHESRILHRDLKSRNIFLKDNQVKIGDFGISRILIGASDKASTFVGTPYYMSPEVLKHEQYDEKCDVWSLGCVLYEICCLEHAFEGSTLMEVMFKIVSDHIPHLSEHYSRGLNNILERMLDHDPHRRHTAKQILQHPIFGKNDSSIKESHKHLTARDRLRIKKQKEADAKIQRLKEVAKIKLAENARIRRESQEKNFLHSSFDNNMQLHETLNGRQVDHMETIRDEELHGTVVFQPLEGTLINSQGGNQDQFELKGRFNGTNEPENLGSTDELIESLIREGHIPEDGDLADTFYSIHDDFESSSDDELPDDHVHMSDSEYRDMVGFMEDALYLEESTIDQFKKNHKKHVHDEHKPTNHAAASRPLVLGTERSHRTNFSKNITVGGMPSRVAHDLEARPMTSIPRSEQPLSVFNTNMVEQRIANMRQRCINTLGEELFSQAYELVKGVRFDDPALSEHNSRQMKKLSDLVPDKNKCMELEQLIFLEQEREV